MLALALNPQNKVKRGTKILSVFPVTVDGVLAIISVAFQIAGGRR